MSARKYAVMCVVLVALLLAACAPAAAPQPAVAPTAAKQPAAQPSSPTVAPAAAKLKALVVGHPVDPPTLDPFGQNAATFQSVTAATIEQLVYFAPTEPKYLPGLATSWSWSADGKTLTLKLRQGVKFHNGEDFNAAAAKFSIEQLFVSKFYSMYTENQGYEGTDAVDDSTVNIRFKDPAGIGLMILARGSYVVPPKYYQEAGAQGFSAKPVGTGPYKFVEWVKDSHIVFDAFPGYWGGKPKLDKVTWRVIPDQAARVAALETGEVQLISNLPPASSERIKKNADLQLISSPGLRQFATFFDMRLDHPVAKAEVRRVLNYAVDKAGLVKLFGGDAQPLKGQFLTPAVIGFNPNVDPFDYNPKKAKDMLAAAGYPNGFSMTLKYTTGRYPLDKEMGEAVAGYLQEVGVKVEQIPLEINEFNRQHAEEKSMGPAWQWGLLLAPDPHSTLGLFRKGSVFNRYADNPKVEELLAKGVRETDVAKRSAIYQELNKIWNDDPLGIYLIVPNDLYAVRKQVTGFTARVDQVIDVSTVDLAQ